MTIPDDLDSLDDHVVVIRRDATRRPKPGHLRYALRRAADELAGIGLTITVRRRPHGPPPKANPPEHPPGATPALDEVLAWLSDHNPKATMTTGSAARLVEAGEIVRPVHGDTPGRLVGQRLADLQPEP